MSEHIKREDVDNVIAKVLSGDLYDEELERLENIIAGIEEIPAVNVIRCKDCKWWHECRMLDDDNGYCSKGERKKMSEYIKLEDAILSAKALLFCWGADNVPEERLNKYAEEFMNDNPSADVIECSVILAKADEQEKQGFIQTAEVLRELVND